MIMHIRFITFCFLAIAVQCFAQGDSIKPIKLEAYLEPYYGYDFSDAREHARPAFLYSHDRHNEINVNIALVKVSVNDSDYRASAGFMTGTYAERNLAGEPPVFRNVFEANAGAKISRSHALWIDAGIFPSHIGFESAIGINCAIATRSVMADNTPYFESGIKLSYASPNSAWNLSALVLNGWQRIRRLPGNTMPSFGTQVTYTVASGWVFNSSTFIGTDSPDSARVMRYFHNFYAIYQLSQKTAVTFGFDYGLQQTHPVSRTYKQWLSPILVVSTKIGKRWTSACRIEAFYDPDEVIISVPGADQFRIFGYSVNADYFLRENVMLRLEARGFHSEDSIFQYFGRAVKYNYSAIIVLAVKI